MRSVLAVLCVVAIANAAPLQTTFIKDVVVAAKTHYGNPADGCESDEQAVRVQGLAGSFCSPDCASAACPTDVPAGVTAAPQCALKSTTGDKKCALICSPSEKWSDLRAGDSQCGAATCQPIQGVGICTYGGGPSPPGPSPPGPSPPGPSPPPPPPAECDIPTGLQCAEKLAPCIKQCKSGIKDCVECLGEDFPTCCPCIKKLDPKFPLSCPGADTVPEFMFVSTIEGEFPPEPPSCIAELKKVCGQCFKGASPDMGCLEKCGPMHIPELVKAGCKKVVANEGSPMLSRRRRRGPRL